MGSFQVDGLGARERAMWGENAPEGVVAKAKLWLFTVWFSSCFQIGLGQLRF